MRTTYEMSPICRRSAFSWICDSQQGNEQHSSIFEFGRRRRVRSVVNLAHRRDDRVVGGDEAEAASGHLQREGSMHGGTTNAQCELRGVWWEGS